jgi:hypothetical protein
LTKSFGERGGGANGSVIFEIPDGGIVNLVSGIKEIDNTKKNIREMNISRIGTTLRS